MPDSETEYRLIVSFPDQSESFVLGFEAGILWEMLSNSVEDKLTKLVHTKNKEVINRMALHLNWSVDYVDITEPIPTEEWSQAHFYKENKKKNAKENPYGLHIVKNGE